MTSKIFERNVPGSTEILQKSLIGVAGCGGLGSNIAISLTRAGIGKLIIADFDKVEESNLNRQQFYQFDIGKNKAEALANHLKAINPEIILELITIKLTKENVPELFKEAEILMEAFDNAEYKRWLIESWCTKFPNKPIICGNGVSGLGNTDSLKVKKVGNIYLCGDGESDLSIGLCGARVAIAANMQANTAIEILMNKNNKI